MIVAYSITSSSPKGAPCATISLEAIPTGTYNVDPAHSSVGFEVRHMGIATVRGKFGEFAGTVDATADAPKLSGTVQVSSVDTGDQQRDAHLTSAEFFDTDNHAEISFHSTAGEPIADGKIRLTGEITIKGTTKPIELTGDRRRGRRGPVGQRAHRARGRGRHRPPRVRPEMEPDAAERWLVGRQRRQAAGQRLGRQGGVTTDPTTMHLAISGSLRRGLP